MSNDSLKLSFENLPNLDDFKNMGQILSKDMKQPVLVSYNIRNLKYFNEIYGINEGDVLIKEMVQYFCLEAPDCILGTKSYVDHLLVLCEGHNKDKDELIKSREKHIDVFLENVSKAYPKARISVVCGMYYIHDGEDFIVAQDNARYARRSITDFYDKTVAFYNEDMRKKSLEMASVIPNFQKALEDKDVVVMLQPKYSVEEGKIIGAEALSRIKDENGNLISPALFVPVLEQANIVFQLDYEVLRQVVEIQKRWIKEGKELIPISVNVSRIDLLEDGFMKKINDLVESSGVPKELIEFEFTETVVVENLSIMVEKLYELRRQGYRIAVDDFGSGYNSLYVLGQIPANVIKFDRGFVLHSLKNDVSLTILKNLVDTFKKISFEVLCEGVETEQEKEGVVDAGCQVIQGYLYDRPLNIVDFEEKYIYKKVNE